MVGIREMRVVQGRMIEREPETLGGGEGTIILVWGE